MAVNHRTWLAQKLLFPRLRSAADALPAARTYGVPLEVMRPVRSWYSKVSMRKTVRIETYLAD
jgi:hypothetical protein